MNTNYVLKGTIAYTPDAERFVFNEESYLVCEEGKVEGIYKELPEKFKSWYIYDYGDNLIIPGMCDMHMHAPQYGFRGMGQNIENSDWSSWFSRYAFPDESRYKDLEYAKKAYERLTDDLLRTTTTRIVAFASLHREATELLMQILDAKGFVGYVGKVNMDRNSMDGLLETTEESLQETRLWLLNTKDKYKHIKPIITPRYTPSCTDEVMRGLSKLLREYKVPVQSHLSEGLDEMAWVKELKPEIDFYGQAYDQYDMFGTIVPAVMAHCVFSSEKEIELLCSRNIWIAHCPNSNLQGSGTAAPVLRYMRSGAKVCLGTDASGGNTLSMMRIISDAMLASKVRWAYTERNGDPNAVRDFLPLTGAFYLATKGGGSFWGKAGSFEKGYDFDAVVLDDSRVADFCKRTTYERIERMVSLSDDRDIRAKFICGKKVL